MIYYDIGCWRGLLKFCTQDDGEPFKRVKVRQAWVFTVVFMITISFFGVYFSITDPALIERRKQASPAAEQSTLQKIVATILFIGLSALFVLSALDRRFGWSEVPPWSHGSAMRCFSLYEQKVRYCLVPYLW